MLVGKRGGGDVFLANQTGDIKVQVALKVLRTAALDERAIARFEAECQALMRMGHVGIAKVFDAGFSEDGRPFIVIEYIHGQTLGEHLTAHTLTIKERLNLFVKICNAVQHAHIKGIVHRDLKPGNVLIAESDARPMLIDFGIARAVDRSSELDLLFTQHAEVLGTPSYMSPEQTLGGSADLDVRSDVYSLGTLLYETLTGAPPLTPDSIAGLSLEQTFRAIREEDPARPSGSDSSISSDLDSITLKALSKEPERRYQSVADFAEDIDRFLTSKPVAATPPTASYRLRKFVRRNRAMVAGSCIAIISLIAGTAISIDQANQANRANKNTIQAMEVAVQQSKESEAQKRVSEAINNFLVNDLLGKNLRYSHGTNVTLQELIDSAADKTKARFRDQPLVARNVEEVIGDIYEALGNFDKAHDRYARSRTHNETLKDRSDYFSSAEQILRKLAVVRQSQQRLDEAKIYWKEWDKLIEGKNIKKEVHLEARGHRLPLYEPATRLALVKELYADTAAHYGEDHTYTAIARFSYAQSLAVSGDYAGALPLFEKHVAALRETKSMTLVTAMSELGLAYATTGDIKRSDETFKEMQSLMSKVLNPGHQNWLAAELKRAAAYAKTGRPQLAITVNKEVFETGLCKDVPMVFQRIAAGYHYGVSLIGSKPERGIEVMNQVLESLEDFGQKHRAATIEVIQVIANAELNLGRKEEALASYKKALAREIELKGPSTLQATNIRNNIAATELDLNNREEAIRQLHAIIATPNPVGKEQRALVSRALDITKYRLGDQPDIGIELHLKALRRGLVGEVGWHGLGELLFERYKKNGALEDLRNGAICCLKAGASLHAYGIIAIKEWIKKDHLAEGLKAPRILVGEESEWSYQASTPPSPEWRKAGFNANAWPTARGKMGYGEKLLSTPIDLRSSASACFRFEFPIEQNFDRPLHATILCDDGGVVFVDGKEVFRCNLPPGPPGHNKYTPSPKIFENTPHGFVLHPELLKSRSSCVIAVQVHQALAPDYFKDDDLWFEFELTEPGVSLDLALKRLPHGPLKEFFGDLLPLEDE